MQEKTINADEWIEKAKFLLEKGMEVKIKPQGLSMLPFIMGDRDDVILKKLTRPLKRGDIVLYRRPGGVYVLHRVHHVKESKLFMMGDSQDFIEGPIFTEQCVAMVETYYKKGVLKDNTKFSMRIKYTVWMWLRPFRWTLIKLNVWRRKHFSFNSGEGKKQG